MLKKYISLLVLILCITLTIEKVSAQNVGINDIGNAPANSAGLDVDFTNKGLLIPRIALLSATDVTTVPSPANSLLIYNTVTAGGSPNNVVPGFYYYNSTISKWAALASNTNGWTQNGTDLYYNTGRVGIGTATPNASAVLDLKSSTNNKGLLIPQVALTASNVALPVVSPANSLLIYNTASAGGTFAVSPGFYYWNGSWTSLSSGGMLNNQWTTSTNDIYTNTTGNVGIGTGSSVTFPNNEKFFVNAGTTITKTIIGAQGSTDNYLQLNIQNTSVTGSASADVVATNDAGTEANGINYVDMGINSSVNSSTNVLGGPSRAYLYSLGNDFAIGNGTSTKSLLFFTNGLSATDEKMRITSTGNVGIGNTTPSLKLDVNGAIGTGKASSTNGSVVFSNSSNTNLLTLNTGVTSASYTLLLPTAQGAANTVLANNGSGTLSWTNVGSLGAWSTLGNAGTNPSTNFIGTTDSQSLIFKVNNAQVQRFEPTAAAIGLAATTNNSTNAYAIGSGAIIGFNNPYSYAIGNSAVANSDSSFAIGNGASVVGFGSFAIGNDADANSTNGLALGNKANVGYSITDGIAIGTNASASGNNSIAIGSSSTSANKASATAASSIALGIKTLISSANAIGIGSGTTIGYNLIAPIAIGNGVTVNGDNGVGIGNGTYTSFSANVTAIGAAASVTGANSTALGKSATVANANSTALGTATLVSGSNSTAIGYNTQVTKNDAIILGNTTNSVGVGSEAFSTVKEKLLVDAGPTSSFNLISGKGSIDNYLQLNIQNRSASAAASSDLVASSDNATETSNFIDMGINSSAYAVGGVLGGPSTAYILSTGNDLAIGNSKTGKDMLLFTTTGAAPGTPTERMRVSSTGQVGIGMTPLTTSGISLFVSGNVQANGVTLTSDRRLKKNIYNLTYGLADLLKLQPVTYNWIDPAQTEKRQIGLIAQDARKIMPEIVTGNESKENLSINYTELVPVLINAIKDLQNQIDELKKAKR